MFVVQENAEKIKIFFQSNFRTSMKCTDNKASSTHNSQWHGVYTAEEDEEGNWQTASVLVNHPDTPVIGIYLSVEFVCFVVQIGVITNLVCCYMYRSTGVDYMKLGTVTSVLVRDVTNKRSLHSVKTGSAQFVVDGSMHFKLYLCCCFCCFCSKLLDMFVCISLFSSCIGSSS